MAEIDPSAQERLISRNIGWDLVKQSPGCGEGTVVGRIRGVGELVSLMARSRANLTTILVLPTD